MKEKPVHKDFSYRITKGEKDNAFIVKNNYELIYVSVYHCIFA